TPTGGTGSARAARRRELRTTPRSSCGEVYRSRSVILGAAITCASEAHVAKTVIAAALVGVLGVAVTAATVQAAPRAVIFGTMERDRRGEWQLAVETTKISRRAVSGSAGSFGIVVEGAGADTFTYQIILVDPAA